MEVLGAVASAGTVVELSFKVASLCYKYSSAVKNANSDIERLRGQAETLGAILKDSIELHAKTGTELATSRKLGDTLEASSQQLKYVAEKLESTSGTSQKKRWKEKFLGSVPSQTLTWPFKSKEITKIIADLKRDQDIFSNALQIDQT